MSGRKKAAVGAVIVAAAIMIAACGRRGGPKGGATAKPPVKPKIAWGEAVEGIQAGLSGLRPQYATGEPISFTIHVRNQGKTTATFARGRVWDGWLFQFIKGSIRGGYLAAEFHPYAGGKRLEQLTVAPGEELALPVTIGKVSSGQWKWIFHTDFGLVDSGAPRGKYSLSVQSRGRIPNRARNLYIDSAPVEIEFIKEAAR